MSTNKLAGNKRKRDEEQPDDRKRKHGGGSSKKGAIRRRKDDDGDEEMLEAPTPASDLVGGEDPIDEYDEEDEEDEQDDYSLDSFIADDNEEIEVGADEDQKEGGGEERKRRRHRKHRKPKKLDDEDLELINENTGLDIRRRKRLLKVSEREKQQVEGDDQVTHQPAVKGEVQSEEDEDASVFAKRRAAPQITEDDQLEQIDTTSRRRVIEAARREQTEGDRAARKMLESSDQAAARRLKQARAPLATREGGENLEDMYDADELDDQFATAQDKLIANTDIPERLQVKIGDRLSLKYSNKEEFKEDLDREVDYVYIRLSKVQGQRNQLYNQEDQVRKAIFKVLGLIRDSNLDVPFVAKYRKYEYLSAGLDESDIWLIFSLEQEYAKYRTQFAQIQSFLLRTIEAIHTHQQSSGGDPANSLNEIQTLQYHLKNLNEQISVDLQISGLEDLKNYTPLILFLKQFYFHELSELDSKEGVQARALPSVRSQYDELASWRGKTIDKFAHSLFINPVDFIRNIVNNSLEKPQPEQAIDSFYKILYLKESDPKRYAEVSESILRFAAVELSVQPYIRRKVKTWFYQNGKLKTTPTEEGNKTLDVLHSSYRVKRLDEKLSELRVNPLQDTDSGLGDVILDVMHNQQQGLVKMEISVEDEFREILMNDFLHLLTSPQPQPYIDFCRQALKQLINTILIPELTREIRSELIESAEDFVIKRAQQSYESLLMTGPFTREEGRSAGNDDPFSSSTINTTRPKRGQEDSELIPDRPRCAVMSVIVSQVDMNQCVATVVVVDKYAELVAHSNFSKLMPPRVPKARGPVGPGGDSANVTEEEKRRQNKLQLSLADEQKDHNEDLEKIKNLIRSHNVDLIVVGANKLEARSIKKVLSTVCENLKNYGGALELDEKLKRTSRGADDEQVSKEVFVIWGSLEVPRLFANSYMSQKLIKSNDIILKQALCLARFEQDPLIEVLNLWSFVTQENQALQLTLHPLQKSVNQSRLAEALEEVNVIVVNDICVDLNLVVNHDHMHILLSFVCALGPRKAKVFIQRLKQHGKPIFLRSEIYMKNLFTRDCSFQTNGFFRIRVPPNEIPHGQPTDFMDQTRVHPESYNLALKIASDCEYGDNSNSDRQNQYLALKSVLQNPKKLKELDMEKYRMETRSTGQEDMFSLVNFIFVQLEKPMADPRKYRTIATANPSNEKLFYMLIDETERTFKRGMIVTAQVIRVMEGRDDQQGGGFAICKLDNGLEARIDKKDLDNNNKNRMEDLLSQGHVITGRIEEIRCKEEAKFGVTLNCHRKNLESHAQYVDSKLGIPEEDLENPTFKSGGAPGERQQKFTQRRINHPNFKNVTSGKALQLLQDQSVGEFIFRPSSKGTENITLTWKFYKNNVVHIDIAEHEKAPGATIGSKLQIGSGDTFDNLQEIVERYINPVNRLVVEANKHMKFSECESIQKLEDILMSEKQAESSRIPYRFTILPEYPQYLVLGYIPRNMLKKEYIKVKPRGYVFHDQFFKQLDALINWFKQNFQQREYQSYQKKQRSPRAKAPEAPQKIIAQPAQDQWGDIAQNWGPNNKNDNGGGSVHSIGDNDQGGSRPGGFGGRGGFAGRGGRGGAEGAPGVCFNCQEPGHMSKNCPQPRKPRAPFGQFGATSSGGAGRGRGGDDGRRSAPKSEGNAWGGESSNNAGFGEQNQLKFDDAQPAWGQADSGISQQSSIPAWGAVDSRMSDPAPVQSWGQKTPQHQPSLGWGDSTDQVPQPVSSGGDWANNNQEAAWGGAGNSADVDMSGRSPDNEGRGSRGRGRGRGDFSGIRPGPAGAGGPKSNNCFNCGQEGHISRGCTNPPQGGGGRGAGGGRGPCYKCNLEGHFARECPNEQQDSGRGSRGRGRGGAPGGDSSVCYKCQQPGHFSRECPTEQGYKRQRNEDGGSNRRGGFGRGSGGGYQGGAGDSSEAWNTDNNKGGADNAAWGANPPAGNSPAYAAADPWAAAAGATSFNQPDSSNNNFGGSAWGGAPSDNITPGASAAPDNKWSAGPPVQQQNPKPDDAWGASSSGQQQNQQQQSGGW